MRAVGELQRASRSTGFVAVDPLLFSVGTPVEMDWAVPNDQHTGTSRIYAVVTRRSSEGVELDFIDFSPAAFRTFRKHLQSVSHPTGLNERAGPRAPAEARTDLCG